MSSQPNAHPDEAALSSLVVELFRDPDDPGRERFSCALHDWNFIREMGKTFGWQPTGTTYLPQLGQRARHKPIKHDYQPGGSQDRKRVEADDSAQWAAALEGARRSPFFSGMLSARVQSQGPGNSRTEQSLQLLLEEFIQFARRGPFTIALKRDR